MNATMTIAHIMGISFIIAGISFLLHKEYFEKMLEDMEKNILVLFMSGIMTMVLGLLIILNINSFEVIYLGIITVIGWIMFIKGAMFLLCPRGMIKIAHMMKGIFKFMWIFGVLYIIIGGYLLYSINFMNWFM